MTITAEVVRVNPDSLLVRDVSDNQEILVHTRNAGQFRVGDRLLILFNGQMTRSVPPQITAISIQRIGQILPPQTTPSQMRVIVLQVGRGALLVWDMRENRLVRVEFPNSQLFRAGQQVIVQYDTLTVGNPVRVTATHVFPV